MNKFPRVKQSAPDWCIPASIENVMKYHGGNISQVDIVIDYIQKFTNFESICFLKIKELMEEIYGANFYYIVESHEGQNLIDYAKQCIKENLPLIVSMRLLGKQKFRIHMYTIVCINRNKVGVFDTDMNVEEYPLYIELMDFISHLAPSKETLLIKPK